MDLMDLSTQELEALESSSVIQPLSIGDIQTEGFILTPNKVEQVAQLLHISVQQKRPLSLNYNDALLMEHPLWMNMKHLKTIRNHRINDLIITVETGITMGELRQTLASQGQQFPLSYPDDLLLADVIAQDRPAAETGLSGGYPRDYVLGLEMVTPDGEITHYGGEVVKNVTGYDLNKFYTGSHHTLGVITAVTLKLAPLPEATQDWGFYVSSPHHPWLEDLLPWLHQHRHQLTACELFQKESWALWIRAQGTKNSFSTLEAELKACLGNPKPTSSQTTRSFLKRTHLDQSHLLRLTIPKGLSALRKTLKEIESLFPEVKSYPIQLRLAAGFVHLIWQPDNMPQLTKLKQPLKQLAKLAQNQGGHLQLLDFPSDFLSLTQKLNLPNDPVAQALMYQLKALYDPHNILHSRHLVFSSPSHTKESSSS